MTLNDILLYCWWRNDKVEIVPSKNWRTPSRIFIEYGDKRFEVKYDVEEDGKSYGWISASVCVRNEMFGYFRHDIWSIKSLARELDIK